MGFRTVVVLSNDLATEWMQDPKLGEKIFNCAANNPHEVSFQYGEVVEQVHADAQTLAILDGYGGHAEVHVNWHRGQTPEDRNLALLKAFADKLGYTVSRKRSR